MEGAPPESGREKAGEEAQGTHPPLIRYGGSQARCDLPKPPETASTHWNLCRLRSSGGVVDTRPFLGSMSPTAQREVPQ